MYLNKLKKLFGNKQKLFPINIKRMLEKHILMTLQWKKSINNWYKFKVFQEMLVKLYELIIYI